MIISSQTETTTTRAATTNGNQLRLVFFGVKLVADKRSIFVCGSQRVNCTGRKIYLLPTTCQSK